MPFSAPNLFLCNFLPSVAQYHQILGDCPQGCTVLSTSLNKYQLPFEGTVRTPTIVLGHGNCKGQLVAVRIMPTSPSFCQADVTFYRIDTKLQAGMMK